MRRGRSRVGAQAIRVSGADRGPAEMAHGVTGEEYRRELCEVRLWSGR